MAQPWSDINIPMDSPIERPNPEEVNLEIRKIWAAIEELGRRTIDLDEMIREVRRGA